MSIGARRWWIAESGLTIDEVQEIARAVWGGEAPATRQRPGARQSGSSPTASAW